MEGPYSTYFENPFMALRMARTDFKGQALYTLRAGRAARLGPAFELLLDGLETATNGFDEKLTDRNESTAGYTQAYREARVAWLSFVDDTMKDYVTPRLRKLPVYADFKKFGKARLAQLTQPELLTQSKALLELYGAHMVALQPTVVADAERLVQAVAAHDQTRDQASAATSSTILALAEDRRAIAEAQRRVKAHLELTFPNPAKVYSFFDFSKVRLPKQKKGVTLTTA